MIAPTSQSAVPLERLSRAATYLAFALAFLAAIAAPLLALSWSNQPFPGFLVEPTLVVTGDGDWPGQPAELAYPQRVIRIGDRPVANTSELRAVLSARSLGDTVSLLTRSPDGSTRLYPSITLGAFPARDMLRLFWLPYLVGLIYLSLGVWIYAARGKSRPGRALAFFCISVAVTSLLLFDLSTTHALSLLWTLAVALTGGALISLGLRFPEEWKPVGRRAWLLAPPYGVSLGLGAWGMWAVHNNAVPWAYISAWGASYRYAAVSVLLFLGIMLRRVRRGESTLVRRQARLVLAGSAVAFIPMSLWFVAPLFRLPLPFNGLMLMPWLIIFPLSVAVALFRYRLPEADTLANRTLVYGVLTAILAGLLPAFLGLSQRLFVAFTGEKSDAAIVITTLIAATAFTPLRSRLERLLNAHFRESPDSARGLKQLGEQARAFTLMSDPEQLIRRLLEEATSALQAESGAVSLVVDGRHRTVYSSGHWTGEAWGSLPLEYAGTRFGVLFLGPTRDRRPYGREEFEALRQTAFEVARAVGLDVACRPSSDLASLGRAEEEGAGAVSGPS